MDKIISIVGVSEVEQDFPSSLTNRFFGDVEGAVTR